MTTGGFRVEDAETGAELGTARFDGSQWHTTSETVASMVRAAVGRGWTPDQVLSYYDGWSNGRIRTTLT